MRSRILAVAAMGIGAAYLTVAGSAWAVCLGVDAPVGGISPPKLVALWAVAAIVAYWFTLPIALIGAVLVGTGWWQWRTGLANLSKAVAGLNLAGWIAAGGLLPAMVLGGAVLAENWTAPGWPIASVVPPQPLIGLIWACLISLQVSGGGLLAMVIIGLGAISSRLFARGAGA